MHEADIDLPCSIRTSREHEIGSLVVSAHEMEVVGGDDRVMPFQPPFRFSSALTAPMIIDSPNQQDQDTTNGAAMIAPILSSRPDNGQTILGTVRLHEQVVEDGDVIELVDERSALSPDQYPGIRDIMNPFLGMM